MQPGSVDEDHLVERSYETVFTEPRGTRQSLVELTWSGREEPLVVHHPRLPFDPGAPDWRQDDFLARPSRFPDFDGNGFPSGVIRRRFIPPEGARITLLHEALRVPASVFSGLPSFLQDTTASARLREDEIGWSDTGFWAAKSMQQNSIGLDERSALGWLRGKKEGVLAYVLSDPSEVIVITADARHADELFEVDLYANNGFLPFGEIRRIIHRGLSRVGDAESIAESLVPIEAVRIPATSPRLQEPAFHLAPLALARVKPSSVSRPEVFYSCVALDHRFPQPPWDQFSRTTHYLATLDQGFWVQDDFDPVTRFVFSVGLRYSCGLAP